MTTRASELHEESRYHQPFPGPPRTPLFHGPVIAKVTPGVWMFTNSHFPSLLKVAPANS